MFVFVWTLSKTKYVLRIFQACSSSRQYCKNWYRIIFCYLPNLFDGNTWKHINSKKNCATGTISALWFIYEDAISAYLAKFLFINGWWQSLPKVSLTMQNVTKISKLLFWNVNGIILSIICLNFLVTTTPILCKRRIVY